MSRESPDVFFSRVALDYLNHADSIAAGVPSETDLPRAILDAGTVAKIPALVIAADELAGGSTARRSVQVLFALMFQNRAVGVDAAADTASLAHSTLRTTAAQYLDAVESRMLDLSALGAFMGALDETRRDGWRVLKVRRVPQPNLERKKRPAPSLTLFAAVVLDVLWHPQPAA